VSREISQITIISQPGVKVYEVGEKYNGLTLRKIIDNSLEYEDSIHSQFDGICENGKTMFSIVNCPVDVSYSEVKP